MLGKYKALTLDIEEIKNRLNLQVMAVCKPKVVNIPDGWRPMSWFDWHLVWLLCRDWPLERLIHKFPYLTIGFVDRMSRKPRAMVED